MSDRVCEYLDAIGGYLLCTSIAARGSGSSAHGISHRKKGTPMKPNWEDEYEMPAEFDFSRMKRIPNPFQQTFQDLHLVSLEDDVASEFPDSESVNLALRQVMHAAKADRVHLHDLKKAS
jgi:hypothetical protein